MGRRKPGEADSLELLLDTVSNAFGGIMFLAILLSMLLKLSASVESQAAPDSSSTQELAAQSGQLEELVREAATLDSAAALLEESKNKLTDATVSALYAKVLDLRQTRSEQEQAIAKQVAAAATAQVELDRMAQEVESNGKKAKELESEVAANNKEIHSQKVRVAQSAIPPHSRPTSKVEVVIIVRYGRVYLKHSWSDDGLTRSANVRDFVVVEEANNSLTLTPNPTRGIPVNEGGEFTSSLQSLLRRHRPSERYICVAIWEDSFAKYQLLKKALIALGYDIRLVPVERGGQVTEGANVNPQVQ